LTWLETSIGLSLFDHLQSDAIFHGKARVEILQFGQDAALKSTRDAREFNQRCMANRAQNGIEQGILSWVIHNASTPIALCVNGYGRVGGKKPPMPRSAFGKIKVHWRAQPHTKAAP
jgi:hypothetical protein